MLTFTHSIAPRSVRIRFSGKPDFTIRAALKKQGFRWSPPAGEWWRDSVGGAADFLAWLTRQLQPKGPDGACWVCRSPEGYFRNEGPATPVRCDACQAVCRYWESLPADEQQRLRKLSQGTELSAAQLAWTNRPQQQQPDATDLAYEDACRDACGL